MLKENKLNKNNNFIEAYYISDLSICDNLINLFEESNNKKVGEFWAGKDAINKKVKDSTDVTLNRNNIAYNKDLNSYFTELTKCLEMYKKKYKFCDKYAFFFLNNDFNIQKYTSSQAYYAWHCEKAELKVSDRHLVFMTYLNDVKDGGETEWYYQNLKIKPEKGLTVIWPAEWTFTHRGRKAVKGNKYIMTGWYGFR